MGLAEALGVLEVLSDLDYRVETDWRPNRVESLGPRGAGQFRSGYEPRLIDLLDLAQLDRLAE